MTVKLSRFLSMSFFSNNAGTAVTTNAIATSVSGWLYHFRWPLMPFGNVLTASTMRFRKYPTTAKIAPTWITTANIFQYASSALMPQKCCATRICAVEETGKNSVNPSTTPNNKANT